MIGVHEKTGEPKNQRGTAVSGLKSCGALGGSADGIPHFFEKLHGIPPLDHSPIAGFETRTRQKNWSVVSRKNASCSRAGV